MQIGESVKMALSSIRGNKLRAGLTLLSIAIGVFAIVGVAATVGVLDATLADQLASLGSNSIVVQRTPALNFGDWHRYRNRKDITLRQALEFRRRATFAENVGMTNWTGGVAVKYEGKETDPDYSVVGADEFFVTNNGNKIVEGRNIDAQDVQLRTDVVLIGAQVVSDLFPRGNPIGKTIKVAGHPYLVIGLLEAKGAVFGENQDNRVIVPITSAAKYFFDEWGTSISMIVRAHSLREVPDAMDQTIGLMRIIRAVRLGEENDFEVQTGESIADTFGSFTGYLVIFGNVCGLIALGTAGFGIMNIMLVSVKERTREIGVRKAIGATRRDILTQFMIEAVTLCQLGAFAGILLGLIGGFSVGLAIDVTPPVPWAWVAIAVVSCLLIGVVFGSYPAWRASRLDPIEALRYE